MIELKITTRTKQVIELISLDSETSPEHQYATCVKGHVLFLLRVSHSHASASVEGWSWLELGNPKSYNDVYRSHISAIESILPQATIYEFETPAEFLGWVAGVTNSSK